MSCKIIKATKKGNLKLVVKLVSKYKNYNIQYKCGIALIYASCYNHKEIVSLLIDNNANLNVPDDNGSTALIWALRENHKEIAIKLIDAGANLDIQDILGDTVLMMASLYNSKKLVLKLLENGADPNIRNIHGHTAFKVASHNNHEEIMNYIKKWQETPKSLKFYSLKCIRSCNINTKNFPPLLLIPNPFIKEISPCESKKRKYTK